MELTVMEGAGGDEGCEGHEIGASWHAVGAADDVTAQTGKGERSCTDIHCRPGFSSGFQVLPNKHHTQVERGKY